ncbi:MAG TPA: hypothetical protein PK156_43485 [Polyangium sp.]|nr:hypothetical protein [Polyangium sp.]
MPHATELIDEETYWDIRCPGWREERARKEGFKEGVVQGQRHVVLLLLVARFGALTPQVKARVEAATSKQLDRMFTKAIGAQTIDEVLAELKAPRRAMKAGRVARAVLRARAARVFRRGQGQTI